MTASDIATRLGERVIAVHADARRAWPGVDVPLAEFARHLEASLPHGSARLAVLEGAHATDLYLACAVARGQPDGLSAFERTLLADVPLFIAHIDPRPAFVEEVKQELRLRLLVGDRERAVRIADYAGRGALRGWLRVAAVRTALNLKRARRARPASDPGRIAAPTTDVELAYLRERYAPALAAALQTTLAALSVDERNVLRLHYLDGLSIDKLGAMYRVHRATVARWIERARARIIAETRRVLAEQLALDAGEVESLIRLVRSKLAISLRRVLGQP